MFFSELPQKIRTMQVLFLKPGDEDSSVRLSQMVILCAFEMVVLFREGGSETIQCYEVNNNN